MKSKQANIDAASPARRPAGLLLLGGAVALLLVGVLGFDRARAARIQGERALAGASAALAEARGQKQLAQRNRVLLDAANGLQQHAQLASVLPSYWSERQINLRQQNLARDQINVLLSSTARNSAQLLKPEEFDLSVTHPDEGLFEVAAGSRQPVMLSLRGTLYFRISERKL